MRRSSGLSWRTRALGGEGEALRLREEGRLEDWECSCAGGDEPARFTTGPPPAVRSRSASSQPDLQTLTGTPRIQQVSNINSSGAKPAVCTWCSGVRHDHHALDMPMQAARHGVSRGMRHWWRRGAASCQARQLLISLRRVPIMERRRRQGSTPGSFLRGHHI